MSNIPTKYLSFWICLILALVTTAVFYQVCTHDFIIYDDPGYVSKNLNIQVGITLKTIEWAFTTGSAANWHPVTWLSLMLDWQLFGANAGGYHFTNLVFHIINTLLLFYVLKQMTKAIWPSAFVAALFALHPLHIQSVAWVSERKDVLSTFFWFLTMWAYIRFVNRPKITNYLLIVVFFALGLMSKPMLVTLPFVLLLLDYWPLERLGPKSGKTGRRHSLFYLLIEKILLFVMVLASSIITFIVQGKSGAIHTEGNYIFPIRFANASISYMQYIIKMIWPTHLAVFYPHPGPNISILYAVISAVFLLVVSILVLRFARNHRYLVTGWFWYLGTLVPVIGLVQVGSQAMADRYSYITLTGLFIIVAWGLPELLAKWTSASSVESRYKKAALSFSALLVISVLLIYTYFQIGYWRNSISLFQRAIDVTKDNYTAQVCISESFCEQGKLDEAIHHYYEAIRIKPDLLPAHIKLVYTLCDVGRLDEAVSEGQKCLQIDQNSSATLNAIGLILGQRGEFDQAVKHLTLAEQIDPNSAEVHTNLGYALIFQGKLDEAVVQFDDALRLKPDWIEPMNDLAWFLAASKQTSIRNPDRAVKLALRACELTDYNKPGILDTLAVSYAAAGNFDKAIKTAEKALELCRSGEQKIPKEKIESRLILFKVGKPYIETQ